MKGKEVCAGLGEMAHNIMVGVELMKFVEGFGMVRGGIDSIHVSFQRVPFS